jgi:hypothetical protein
MARDGLLHISLRFPSVSVSFVFTMTLLNMFYTFLDYSLCVSVFLSNQKIRIGPELGPGRDQKEGTGWLGRQKRRDKRNNGIKFNVTLAPLLVSAFQSKPDRSISRGT